MFHKPEATILPSETRRPRALLASCVLMAGALFSA